MTLHDGAQICEVDVDELRRGEDGGDAEDRLAGVVRVMSRFVD